MSRSLDTPAALAELVEYQDGGVVSQALVKSKAGTVSLFAFDASEALSEHTAPYDALLLIVEGRATVSVAETAHAMGPGQIVLLPANVPHAVHADAPFKMLLVMIREA
jgi:quercetin dioxygenase-like cupin family protein